MTIKTFGELEAGDVIPSGSGEKVVVSKAYDPHLPERMYEVESEAGEAIKVSGNHLWYVETDIDVAIHRARLKAAKKTLKGASERLLTGLESIALQEEVFEVTMADVLEILDFVESPKERFELVVRLLQAVGHVVEEEVTLQDMATGETALQPMEKVYDGRRVAQQLLSLTGQRKYRKLWPVVRGRVITTDELFESYEDVALPTAEPL